MKKRLVSLVTICFLFLFNASVIVSASESINGEGNMEFYIERDAIADQLDVRPSQIVAIEAVDENVCDEKDIVSTSNDDLECEVTVDKIIVEEKEHWYSLTNRENTYYQMKVTATGKTKYSKEVGYNESGIITWRDNSGPNNELLYVTAETTDNYIRTYHYGICNNGVNSEIGNGTWSKALYRKGYGNTGLQFYLRIGTNTLGYLTIKTSIFDQEGDNYEKYYY